MNNQTGIKSLWSHSTSALLATGPQGNQGTFSIHQSDPVAILTDKKKF